MKRTIPASAYGVPLKGIVYPIIEDDGTLSGVLGTSTSLDSIENTIQYLSAVVVEIEEIAKIILSELH